MPIYTKSDRQVLHIHIPKTGGFTIEKFMRVNQFTMSYRLGGVYGDVTQFRKANGCSPQHMHADLLAKHFNTKRFDYNFTVVRHPVSRIVSEYNFRKTHHKNFSEVAFSQWLDEQIAQFKQRPFIYDNHIRPQHEFLWRGPEVFKIEDGYNQIFNTLCEQLPDTNMFEFKKSNNASQKFISPQELSMVDLDKIYDFYKKDFSVFNYELDQF